MTTLGALYAIRARDANYAPDDPLDFPEDDSAIADRRVLLAEVDRLTVLKTTTLEVLADDGVMVLTRHDERARILAAVEALPNWNALRLEVPADIVDHIRAAVVAAIERETT